MEPADSTGTFWQRLASFAVALIRIVVGYVAACIVVSGIMVLGTFLPWPAGTPADELPFLLIVAGTGAVYTAALAFPLAVVGILLAEFVTDRSPGAYALIGLLTALLVVLLAVFDRQTANGSHAHVWGFYALILVAGCAGGWTFGLVRGRRRTSTA